MKLRNMMPMLCAFAVVAAALTGCSSGPSDNDETKLVGNFAGSDIAMHVTTNTTAININCGPSFTLPHGVTLDAEGHFSFAATINTPLSPSRDTTTQAQYSVQVSGQVAGDALSLDIAVMSGTTSLYSVHFTGSRNAAEAAANGICRV